MAAKLEGAATRASQALGVFEHRLHNFRLPTAGEPQKGFSFDNLLPKTKLARGGIVTQPTRALIGEAGPEAVIPLGSARAGLVASATPQAAPPVSVNVNIDARGATDPAAIYRAGRELKDFILDTMQDAYRKRLLAE